MKGYCQLQENKNLVWLNRAEGGIGGDNNTIHKQIRFRHIFDGLVREPTKHSGDNEIRFNKIYSTDSEQWSYHELYDLMYGFIKTANYYIYGCYTPVSSVCVSGSIEKKNTLHGYCLKKSYDSITNIICTRSKEVYRTYY